MAGDEKLGKYDSLPIPTYEEATSSRPTSSQNLRGPQETSDDAERQGLLGEDGVAPRSGAYAPPTVESARPSLDSDLSLPEVDGDGEAAEVRRDMEQMELMDSPGCSNGRRRGAFSKRFTNFKNTFRLSSLHLPSIRLELPSFKSLLSSLPSWPEEYKLSIPVFAKLFGLFLIALLIYTLFALDIIPSRGRMIQHYDPEAVRARVQMEANTERLVGYLKYMTSFDHVAGTEGDLYLAKWQEELWAASNLDQVVMTDYHVYLNYPTKDGRRVAIVDPPELAWEAALEEDDVIQDQGKQKQQTLNWFGSSRAGNVTGHLVYANGGSRQDFAKLSDMGVDLQGAVVLVRYYHTEGDRALKIKAAEAAGAAGCLIYSDPKEDGFLRGLAIPDGPWRPSDSIQRGGTALKNWIVGDVLTPGWASTLKAPRESENYNPGLNNIPSLPLAWRDAQRLLQVLQGHGQKVPSDDWVGGVPEVAEWWTGDNTSPMINLQNLQDENKLQHIWNLHGIIQGMERPGKKIIVGNHRDAWCFGSVDPGSGQAILMEVVAVFSVLRQLGWRPLRTIEFVSWDAKEYNLIGSTEYVEDNIDYLRMNGVGYMNGKSVSGPNFRAAASPLFERALMHVLDRVSDPLQNATLRRLWDDKQAELDCLGTDGDHVPFQSLAGTSSIDFSFDGPEGGTPYHSCYETFDWMAQYGDPGFIYHKLMVEVWALLILEMADRPIVPYDLKAYADAIHGYVQGLLIDATIAAQSQGMDLAAVGFNLQPLEAASDTLAEKAAEFHAFDDVWATQVLGHGGFESNAFALKRMAHNDRLSNFDSDLLDLPGMFPGDEDLQHGIPGRDQYKHIIFGPQAWSAYQDAYFPAVRDALDARNWTEAQYQVDKAARILHRAAVRLVQ